MNLYQPQQIGLFTFYKQQDQYNHNRNNQLYSFGHQEQLTPNIQNGIQNLHLNQIKKNTRNSHIRKTGPMLIMEKYKKTEQNEQIKNQNSSNMIPLHPHQSTCNRTQKISKTYLKRTQSNEDNTKQLKKHLQELLKTEDNILQLPYKHTEERISLDQNQEKNNIGPNHFKEILNNCINLCSINKQNKQKKNIIHTSKKEKNILKCVIYPKVLEEVKKKDEQKLPQINKKSHSEQLKDIKKLDLASLRASLAHCTRYLSPNKQVYEQQYLSPICTERKPRKGYAFNFERFPTHKKQHQYKSTEQLTGRNAIIDNDKERDLQLQSFMKCTKFK